MSSRPPSTAILADLTPDDTRQLVLAEDELATSRRLTVIIVFTNLQSPLARFTRIFPTSTSHRYFRFMEKSRYYNLLLRTRNVSTNLATCTNQTPTISNCPCPVPGSRSTVAWRGKPAGPCWRVSVWPNITSR